jgi:hypothetical protein
MTDAGAEFKIMNIIDKIISLFPLKKNRYDTRTDKNVNLTLPNGTNTSGGSNVSGGGTSTDQNPTGTGGSQGTNVGVDGLTAAERLKIRLLKTYTDKLALYKAAAADFNLKFVEGQTPAATMAILRTAVVKLKAEVAAALNGIKTYAEYTAAKISFEAVPVKIGSYKVKVIV